jgi:hypothetical protein
MTKRRPLLLRVVALAGAVFIGSSAAASWADNGPPTTTQPVTTVATVPQPDPSPPPPTTVVKPKPTQRSSPVRRVTVPTERRAPPVSRSQPVTSSKRPASTYVTRSRAPAVRKNRPTPAAKKRKPHRSAKIQRQSQKQKRPLPAPLLPPVSPQPLAASSHHRGIVYGAFALAALIILVVALRVLRSFVSLRAVRFRVIATSSKQPTVPAKKPAPEKMSVVVHERSAPETSTADGASEILEAKANSVPTQSRTPTEPLPTVETEAPPAEPMPTNGAAPPPAVPEPPPAVPATIDAAVASASENEIADGAEGEGSESDVERCDIAYWRGYRKAAFYARAFDEEGLEVALAESGEFRARGNGMPERTEAAAAAHRALLDTLAEAGWKREGDGPAWFAVTLRRD